MSRLSDSYERANGKSYSPRRYSRWSKFYYGIPRRLRLAVISTISVIVILILLHIARNERDYALKQWPSVFSSLGDGGNLWHPPHPVRHQNGSHIDDRYIFMRFLGKGAEGTASLYVDQPTGEVVVVKTYTGIPRNPVPAELVADFPEYATKQNWQAEIEAGLHFGDWKNGNESAFVPVRDYFVLESGPQEWNWAFVTPFVEDGTLESLAKRTTIHERTPQKIDKIFRPTFEKLLTSLKLLHDAGFCHDDIKSDNIFIANATHWLLGDLGNVRHFEHPWHATRRWKRENQLSNCVRNDIRRTLKTYMTFLREAAGNQLDFDREFHGSQQAWNSLYWSWIEQPLDTSATLDLSSEHDPRRETEWKPDWTGRLTERQQACLERKVDVELTTMTVHLGPWDHWPLRAC